MAEIRTRFGLDTKDFKKGINQSDNAVKKFKNKFVAAVGALSFAALGNRALNLAAEIDNLSNIAGLSASEFQKLSFAAKTVGVEQDKVADIIKDVNDKFGDFLSTGAGPLKDFFEKIAPKIGVTADEFRGLSGKDALQLYVDSLRKANVSQQEMTFYMEALASDATALLPLLNNNGEAMKMLGDEAERTGQIMADDTVKGLKDTKIALEQIENRVTVGVAPAIIFLARVFESLMEVGKLFRLELELVRSGIVNFGGAILKTVEVAFTPLIDSFKNAISASNAFGLALEGEFSKAGDAIRNSVSSQIDLIKQIPEQFNEIPKAFRGATRQFVKEAELIKQVAKEKIDFQSIWSDVKMQSKDAGESISESLSKGVDSGVEKATESLESLNQKLEALRNRRDEIIVPATEGDKGLQKELNKIFEDEKKLKQQIADFDKNTSEEKIQNETDLKDQKKENIDDVKNYELEAIEEIKSARLEAESEVNSAKTGLGGTIGTQEGNAVRNGVSIAKGFKVGNSDGVSKSSGVGSMSISSSVKRMADQESQSSSNNKQDKQASSIDKMADDVAVIKTEISTLKTAVGSE